MYKSEAPAIGESRINRDTWFVNHCIISGEKIMVPWTRVIAAELEKIQLK